MTTASTTNYNGDGEPRMEVIEVTPAQAEAWLKDRNTHNRAMNHAHVERIARDIAAGRFLLTHQGIAFSTEDVLLDGQNRLAAIVKAGVPVRLRVWFDMPPQTQAVTITVLR